MRTKNARPLSLTIAALLLLQLLVPFHLASAIEPENLTNTPYLAVHGTDYTGPPGPPSSITITMADGITSIIPDPVSGAYEMCRRARRFCWISRSI